MEIDDYTKKRKLKVTHDARKSNRNAYSRAPRSNETIMRLQNQISEMSKALQETNKKLGESQRAIKVLKTRRTKKRDGVDPAIKQMESELRAFIKYDFGRRYKFEPPGYKKWSDDPYSVCQIIMKKGIKFPPEYKEEDRMHAWTNVIAENIKPMMTEYKNKILQPMRQQFNSKCLISLSCTFYTH